MENSDWVMKDYPLTYIKTFQGVADVRVFHNIYWDEDDYGVPPNRSWLSRPPARQPSTFSPPS